VNQLMRNRLREVDNEEKRRKLARINKTCGGGSGGSGSSGVGATVDDKATWLFRPSL
jgi:hypothetical protein